MADDAAPAQGTELEVTDDDLRSDKPEPKGKADKPAPKGDKAPAEPADTDEVAEPVESAEGDEAPAGDGGEFAELFGGDMEAASIGAEMLRAFMEDPEQMYRDLGELILEMNPDSQIQFADDEGELDEELDLGSEDGGEQYDDPRLQYVEQLQQREQEEQADSAYDAELQKVEARLPGFDRNLFTHFVISNNGNLAAAFEAYLPYHREPEPEPEAPNVLEGGGTPPPEAPTYTSLDDALDDFLSENRARRG